MRIAGPAIIALAASCAVIIAGTSLAQAQTSTRRAAPPLVIQKRSFLDMGKVVPLGTESRYVQDQTRFNRTPDYFSQRSLYGQETLPGRFDLPGY